MKALGASCASGTRFRHPSGSSVGSTTKIPSGSNFLLIICSATSLVQSSSQRSLCDWNRVPTGFSASRLSPSSSCGQHNRQSDPVEVCRFTGLTCPSPSPSISCRITVLTSHGSLLSACWWPLELISYYFPAPHALLQQHRLPALPRTCHTCRHIRIFPFAIPYS